MLIHLHKNQKQLLLCCQKEQNYVRTLEESMGRMFTNWERKSGKLKRIGTADENFNIFKK